MHLLSNHKDTDSGYLDPVSPTCTPKYHNRMATRPLGQAADSRSMLLTFSRWYKDFEELAVGTILGTHDERYSLKWRLVIGRPARPGWSLKVVMVKIAKHCTVEEFGNIDLLVMGWG